MASTLDAVVVFGGDVFEVDFSRLLIGFDGELEGEVPEGFSVR